MYALKLGIASIFFANSNGIDTLLMIRIEKTERVVINNIVGIFSAISPRFEPKRLTPLYIVPRQQPHGLPTQPALRGVGV